MSPLSQEAAGKVLQDTRGLLGAMGAHGSIDRCGTSVPISWTSVKQLFWFSMPPFNASL